jgi:outer membrane protein
MLRIFAKVVGNQPPVPLRRRLPAPLQIESINGGLRIKMRLRVIIGAMVIASLMTGTARAEVKLAFVDIQRALNDCRAGKAAKERFRGRVQQLQSELQGEQDDVERLKKELEQKGPLMQPDQRQNLEDEYTKKLRHFQDDYKNSRDELQQKDNEVTGAIVRDLATVVRRVSEKEGYDFIIEKGTLLWGRPSLDITDQIIHAYDAMNVRQPGALSAEDPGGFVQSAAPPARNSGGGAAPEPPEPSDSDSGGHSTITK